MFSRALLDADFGPAVGRNQDPGRLGLKISTRFALARALYGSTYDVGAGIALEDFHQEIADVVGYDEGCNWNLWARTLHCMKLE